MSALIQAVNSQLSQPSLLPEGEQEKNLVALSFFISPQWNNELNDLAAKIGGTKSDVFRKAIALLELAVDARDTGKKFGIAEKDQPLATEIVGI